MSTNETSNLAQVVLEKWGIQPVDTDQQVGKSDDVVCDLGKARKRRQKAQEKTDELDIILAGLQEKYVVTADPACIWNREKGRQIKEQGFKLRYRSPRFKPPGGDRSRSIANIFLDDPNTTRRDCAAFHPGQPAIGEDYINLWTPPQIEAIDGDPGLLLEHMDYIYDGEQESIDFTLDWMALPLQKPGTKMESGILVTGKQGTGKTIIGLIARKLHGFSNTSKIEGGELQSPFNDYMLKATLVMIEEVCLKGRWDLMDRIKDTITSSQIRVNIKNISPIEINNVSNFMLFSNHSNALAITDDDRRWHVHVSNQLPKSKEYFDRLFTWLKKENGCSIVYHYLMNRDLSNFSRHSKPPMSRCKIDLAQTSKSLVEQQICDDILDKEGLFVSDLIVPADVIHKYSRGVGKSHNENAVKNALERHAANTSRRVKIKLKNTSTYGSVKKETQEINLRLWSTQNHEKWKEATADELRVELKKAYPDMILPEC
jgi:hypothetical protein